MTEAQEALLLDALREGGRFMCRTSFQRDAARRLERLGLLERADGPLRWIVAFELTEKGKRVAEELQSAAPP